MNNKVIHYNFKEDTLKSPRRYSKYLIKEFTLIGPLIEPIEITDKLGISVFEIDNFKIKDKKILGALKKQQPIEIYINSQLDKKNQRFFICRQIWFNYKLNKSYIDFFENKKDLYDINSFPNIFARNILLLEEEFVFSFLTIRNKNISKDNKFIFKEMSDLFGVPIFLIEQRFKDLYF